MDRECPAYLTVGTDVSAKYRGAFCEAKVKTTTKHVKCKINFKGLSAAIVSDEFVNGTLKIGAVVNARHPEQGTYIEGIIAKLTDASTYTVVFDDGDEKTLRRSSLCLQGERHFNESETLDHLPLTDPENFGTPVVRDAKKRKKRKPIESDEEQTASNVSPNAKKRATNTGKGSEDIGKVVIVDVNEKKKNSWFPALIIHPKRTKELSPKNKDNLIVKSFKDNKVHNIAKNSTKPFTTKDHVYKGDINSIKTAVNKAVSYIDTGNLPTNWDSGIITEEDFLFESDDEVDSDEESDEDFDVETDAWLASLYKFMEERGTPINKPPVLGYQDLNLFKLYKLVHGLGGCRKVTDHQKWREISFKMGIPVINSSSHHNIKASYVKYLQAFEEYNRKLGPGLPGPLTRTTRRRSSFERPTLSPIRPRVTRTADEDGDSDNEREPPMLKRRVTITELDEEVEEKPVKKSERQNKKDDKQKAKDVKKEESDKEDDDEEKSVKSKASEQKAKSKDTGKVDNKDKQHTEDAETSDNQSQETDTDYQLGEKIKVLYGRGRTQKVYEAKIIEIDVEAHWHKMYRVHYVGWNIRHDEWIGNNRIVGSEDRVKLRKKQKQEKEKEKEKKLKEKKDKEEKERLQREEKERIQKEHEKLLKDKKEKEKERLEKERIKKEKEKIEKEKKEKLEREIREKERLEREREKQEKEKKRKEKEKAEQEKKAKEEERRLKELEIAESLENKKKEKKDEKGKGKGKQSRSKEEPEALNTDKGEKEDQSEVERPKTPGKRGRPSLKSNTTPTTARSNSVTRKVPSPVSSKSTKSTRTRRSDRNSLSESPFAAGLDVKPRTRRSSIHSDAKFKLDDDSESETSNSIKDEDEKAEEIKDQEEEQEETPVIEENEDIKVQVEEKDEKEEEKKKEEEDKQVEEEPVKEKEEIKEEILPVEVPVAEKEVLPEQLEEVVENVTTPKGKEKKKERKEGKSKKRKEGKGKKDKTKDQIIEQSEESIATTAPLESNTGNQDSIENRDVQEEDKAVVHKKENEDERPPKKEGKKSRKRRRSKSSSERKSKEAADFDNRDKEEDTEFKRSLSSFKEEEGAAALMDIYNPGAAVQVKLESMAQTSKSLTPPTTPENSPPNPSSPADQSMHLELQHDERSNRSDSDGLIDVADVTDVQHIGNQSPHCDASVSSNTSAESMNGISQEKRPGSSKKRRRTNSEADTPNKRKRRSHKHSNHHDKKKRHSKEPVRHSSSDTDDTSNNDAKPTVEKVLIAKTPEHNGKHISRPGRTPKYNFRVDLTNIHDPEERISLIQHQLDEMRKIYMSLKNEVASIDRRRKKLRRKEREGKAAAAASLSADRRTSDRHSNDTS